MDKAGLLLEGWEMVNRKSQVSLWVLLSLSEGDKRAIDIMAFLQERTNGQIDTDEKSLYRALRRFRAAEMVNELGIPGQRIRKLYSLTPLGKKVLEQFVRRNINEVFYNDSNATLFKDI